MNTFGVGIAILLGLVICWASLLVATRANTGKVIKFFLILVAFVAGVWTLLALVSLLT